MRVVLLKEVPDLGEAGEVKDVADGHARNFLIPRGFAQKATKGAERLWEEQKASMVRRTANGAAGSHGNRREAERRHRCCFRACG